MIEDLNKPEYFLPDVIKQVVEQAGLDLGMVLNFDYGYVDEINLRLVKKNATTAGKAKKFPLVWLVSPFITRKGESFDYFGVYKLRLLIVVNSQKDSSTPARYEKQYKLLLSKIARKVIEGLNQNEAIKSEVIRSYSETYNAFWGERQKSVFEDIVDVLELDEIEITILNNQNC